MVAHTLDETRASSRGLEGAWQTANTVLENHIGGLGTSAVAIQSSVVVDACESCNPEWQQVKSITQSSIDHKRGLEQF